MHAEPQALAFIAAAGAIRKPTPGAARATKLIESVDAIVHRSGSFAAGIGALQADVHTLCDEIARLKTPASHYPWQSLEVRGRTWMVLPCKTCDFTGELQAASLWVNGAWLEAEEGFGEAFSKELCAAFNEAYPPEAPDSDDGPAPDDFIAPGCADSAEAAWAAGRDAVAAQ